MKCLAFLCSLFCAINTYAQLPPPVSEVPANYSFGIQADQLFIIDEKQILAVRQDTLFQFIDVYEAVPGVEYGAGMARLTFGEYMPLDSVIANLSGRYFHRLSVASEDSLNAVAAEQRFLESKAKAESLEWILQFVD